MCYYLRQQHSISPLESRRSAMVGKLHRPFLRVSDKPVLCTSGDELSLPIAQGFVGGNILHPGPSVPQKVVIGFDIGPPEIRLPDSCVSPRSVLDPIARSPPREKQALTRSCLGGSLLVEKGSHGVGLAFIAHIEAEEELKKRALVAAHPRQESLPIAIMSSNDRNGDFHLVKTASKFENAKHFDLYPGHSYDTVPPSEYVDDEMHLWPSHGCSWEDDEDQDEHDKDDNNSISVQQKSIFAVASAPSYCSSHMRSMASFDACVFCRCAFEFGEDIFMYRGDQAFCSAECRARQIEVDEFMENQAVGCTIPTVFSCAA